ncbi:MAG TPA: acyl-CoA carboxylase subunit epsilon [Mycobacteriales bacterium]|nr:acyl-CoA carboxylase subunit epsilon [Mycobacteriales bacterium]
MTEATTDAAAPVRPLLRVVRGNPTPEEIAALVAVLALRGPAVEPEPVPPSRWASRAAGLRRPLSPGPGAWRASGLPGPH